MTASFEINTIRLKRCRRRAKAAAGACARRISEDEQRFHVRAPLGRRQHRQFVHHFLASQPHARDEPQHRRMKPEHRSHDFLSHHPDPVVAPHVKQLVTEHDTSDVRGLRSKDLRQEHHRATEAERDRLAARHIADFRSRPNELLHVVVHVAERSEVPVRSSIGEASRSQCLFRRDG